MSEQAADVAILDGAVYTMDDSHPWAEAVAVRGEHIVAVGTNDEIRAFCDTGTEILGAGGKMVLPGFQDAHVHPPSAGVEMVRCDLTEGSTRPEYLALIGAYARANPEADWIRGGGWASVAFPGGVPTAADLDAVVGQRPAYLPNNGHHSAWVSSRALELASITAATPDPPDGRIERDEAGRPTGVLHDGAMSLVEDLLPPLTRADIEEGTLAAQSHMHALGITAWQDAMVSSSPEGANSYDSYLSLAVSGRLTARVVGAMWWDRHRGAEQLEHLVELRDQARQKVDNRMFRATSVKIMQDGVCGTFTAAMLSPYLDAEGHETDNCGLSFIEPDALKSYVTSLDAAGFQVHVHSIGDRAVREALDAVESARSRNGAGQRHHLAHLEVVHPEDLSRFRQLGVIANFQPLWACEDAHMAELTMPFLGPERSSWQYPIGSLARRGVSVAFGSDWPVSSANPLEEMQVAITRMPPGSSSAAEAEPFLPDERVSLAFALSAFTRGSAYVNGLEASTGSIETGKLADLILLDRNLFDADADGEGPGDAQVLLTMVGGRAVYDRTGR